MVKFGERDMRTVWVPARFGVGGVRRMGFEEGRAALVMVVGVLEMALLAVGRAVPDVDLGGT
jgi:hypothetical protein